MSRHLDPAALDAIVEDLDLAELETLDRLSLALRLWLKDLASWLRRLSEDDDSWLHRVAELLAAVNDFDAGWNLLDLLVVALPFALAAVATSALAVYLWRTRRPRRSVPLPAGRLAPAPASASRDIGGLPASEQPPALFHHACTLLAARGVLAYAPDQTNSAVARTADGPPALREDLLELARAADRALFGAWQPSAGELDGLHRLAVDLETVSVVD